MIRPEALWPSATGVLGCPEPQALCHRWHRPSGPARMPSDQREWTLGTCRGEGSMFENHGIGDMAIAFGGYTSFE